MNRADLIAQCHEDIRRYKEHITAAQKRLDSCEPKLRAWHNGAIQAYRTQIKRVEKIIKMYESKEDDTF